MRLGAWGFRGTPTQGVAMPVADFEAGGKGPLVVSFRCGLGVRVIPTVCSCLDASHLKWKETGTHLPACAQGLNRYEINRWQLSQVLPRTVHLKVWSSDHLHQKQPRYPRHSESESQG